MARTAKRYKKNTEKKVLGIPVCMAAIYVRLSVDSDEKKSEPIETQVTLIKDVYKRQDIHKGVVVHRFFDVNRIQYLNAVARPLQQLSLIHI